MSKTLRMCIGRLCPLGPQIHVVCSLSARCDERIFAVIFTASIYSGSLTQLYLKHKIQNTTNNNNYVTVYNQSDSIYDSNEGKLQCGPKISIACLYRPSWHWHRFVRSWRPCCSAQLMKHYHSDSVTVQAVMIAARTQYTMYLLAK